MNSLKKILYIIHNRTLHRRKIKIPPCPPLFTPSSRPPLPAILSRPPLPKGGWGDLRTVSLTLGLALFFSAIGGCDYARMNDQESVRTYKKEIPEMPPETIPITGGFQILSSANPKDLKNPLPYTQESVDQGKEAYFYFCVQCHGPKADGNGTVGQSFAPLPANLRDAGVQKQSDGELFAKITLGFRRHPPLASTVSDGDRWAVVNYIRSMKKKSG